MWEHTKLRDGEGHTCAPRVGAPHEAMAHLRLHTLVVSALRLHVMYYKTTKLSLSNQYGIQVATIQATT